LNFGRWTLADVIAENSRVDAMIRYGRTRLGESLEYVIPTNAHVLDNRS